MLSTLTRRATRPATRFTILLGALLAVASCKDSTGTGDLGEPEVVAARLIFTAPPTGTQRIVTATDVNGDYSVAVWLTTNLGATGVHSQWLKLGPAGNEIDERVVMEKFRLKIDLPANSGIQVTQTETNPLGSIFRVDEPITDVPVQFSLVRIADNQTIFGPFTVKVSAPEP